MILVGTIGLGAALTPVLIDLVGHPLGAGRHGAFLPVLAALTWRQLRPIDAESHVPEHLDLLRADPDLLAAAGAHPRALGVAARARDGAAGTTGHPPGRSGDRFYVVESGRLHVTVDGSPSRRARPRRLVRRDRPAPRRAAHGDGRRRDRQPSCWRSGATRSSMPSPATRRAHVPRTPSSVPGSVSPRPTRIPRVDPRIQAYARVLVDCIEPQPGWQVLVRSQPPARPLIEEVARELARRGSRALVRLGFDASAACSPATRRWSCSTNVSDIELHEIAQRRLVHGDRRSREHAEPARTSPPSGSAPGRQPCASRTCPFLMDEKPWVGCYYPTAAAAQDAGLPLPPFEDFLYGAVLIDWQALRAEDGAASRSTSTGRSRCGSSAPRPTSRSASRAARARSTRSARTCRAARSSTRPSRTRPKGSSAIRSIRPATSTTRSPACASASRAARSSTPPPRATSSSCSARSTPTRAHAGSASSGSAATRASSATCATPSSTRRWRARSISRSAPASRSSAA